MSPFNDATKFLRIAAMAIFVYDWALTLPAEIRMYRRQSSLLRMSTACMMLILVRYLGLIALITNFIGFFAHVFVDNPKDPNNACRLYFRVMPIMQCFASWASHAVFVVRTVAICNVKGLSTIALIFLAVTVSGVEMFSQLYSFFKFDVGSSGNCLLQYSDDHNLSYLYYLVRVPAVNIFSWRPHFLPGPPQALILFAASTIFDVVIIVLTYRGLSVKFSNLSKSDAASTGFNDVLWNSSILYFSVTTFFNMLNLGFYAYFGNSNATVLGAMGIAFTSMMSARVILDLHSYAHRPTPSYQLSGLRSGEQTSRASVGPSQVSGQCTLKTCCLTASQGAPYTGSDKFQADAKMRDSGIGVFRTVELRHEYEYDDGPRRGANVV
ncbi:hypothetical protein BD626DRAFT_396790 [Schizophyllum amplum]|uniref:DUF6533 domain-containing protein n=1 Tax=Schizophyllum amplum TaxID=97359 RepID=A0A550CQ44_9AGAR|nr:hypothetical protein BD626DRAFT_396790 [Auriculariopsis ampla]